MTRKPSDEAGAGAAMNGWLDIDTAPRDGRALRLVNGNWHTVGSWHRHRNCWVTSGPLYSPYPADEQPTHWKEVGLGPHEEAAEVAPEEQGGARSAEHAPESEAALEACPFCGDSGVFVQNTSRAPNGDQYVAAWCSRCGATSRDEIDDAHAIAAWNRRSSRVETAREEMKEENNEE